MSRINLVIFLFSLCSCLKTAINTTQGSLLETGNTSSSSSTASSAASQPSSGNQNTNSLQSTALQWSSLQLPTHQKNFNLSFKMTAGANLIDAVTGLSAGSATTYTALSPIIRFYTNGKVEAYNSSYLSSSLNYQAGTVYTVEMSVNTDLQQYSAKVTPSGGSAVLVANRFAFRAAAQNLSYINVVSQSGSHTVSNIVASAFNDLGNSSSSSSTSSTASASSSSSSSPPISAPPPVVPALVGCVNNRATSLSYYGITWHFKTDNTTPNYVCGQFANGEPYIVGPVTISNINPNPSQSTYHVQHGSMINPIANTTQGFDSNAPSYDPIKNATLKAPYEESVEDADGNTITKPVFNLAFPFTLQAGDILVSAKSQSYYPTWIKTYVALTVLASPPPSGSFRPGLYGGNHVVKFNVSQINWSVLKNFTAPPSTPSKASIEAEILPLPWFEWKASWDGNSLQGDDNTTDGPVVDCDKLNYCHYRVYGRETAQKFGRAGLWLNTNQPLADKLGIAIQIIQNGIDIQDYLLHGGGFYHDGGHKMGRKLPLVMAAMLLNDAGLKATAANPDLFQEDQQTFIVQQSDIGRVVDSLCRPGDDSWCGREVLQYRENYYKPDGTYVVTDVGMAEWGIRHRFEPFSDNASWSATYRGTVIDGMMGPWLAASLMGALSDESLGPSIWHHPAAYKYMQRVGFSNVWGNFIYDMSDFPH